MIRRLFANIVIVALMVFGGYTTWRVHTLEGQVAILQSEVHSRHASLHVQRKEPQTKLSWFQRGDLHRQRASDALAKGDIGTASREWTASQDAYAHAKNEAEANLQNTSVDWKRRLTALQVQANEAYQKVDEVKQQVQ
jgi:hypothetical protein